MSKSMYKCILVGNWNAGKTSFLWRFKNGQFLEKNTSESLEYAIRKKAFGNEEKMIQLWDTLGMEYEDSLGSSYFRDSRGVLLVYDINDKQSAIDLLKWYDYSLKNVGSNPNVMYFIIGTKCDLIKDRSNIESVKKEFTDYEIEDFFEVSSKSGESFAECVDKIMTSVFEKTRGTLPRNGNGIVTPENDKTGRCNCS